MTLEEAIDILQEKISPCVAGKWKEAVDVAISALQAQDSETRKICNTCKHDPPSKKWPCVDCDMREPADRWELNECQTCKHYDDASEKCGECLELGIDNYEPKEMENSKELSKTQKALDTISRTAAIDIVVFECGRWTGLAKEISKQIKQLPSAQPETAIPLSWIEKHIEWLKSMDNAFSNLTAMNISVMAKKWKEEKERKTDG